MEPEVGGLPRAPSDQQGAVWAAPAAGRCVPPGKLPALQKPCQGMNAGHDTGVRALGPFPLSITLDYNVGKLIVPGVAFPAQKLPLAAPKLPMTQV